MIIQRLMVANRGEIACRIIRTCRELGIETVLAASEADLESLAARQADETRCIGPAPAAKSYLNVDRVVIGASAAGVDAIHPGYGFLSENAALAERCNEAGIIFIGPTTRQLEAVGDKLRARDAAIAAGLAVVPGGPMPSADNNIQDMVDEIGWPILVKAVGGGGGRGMKLVNEPADLDAAVELAKSEAGASFGDSRVYLERYVERGRHIEVQVLGDGASVIHLGDRDCSIQRRYQKLIEEAPAPDLPESTRGQMHAAAVGFAAHLEYRGAGTIEFLLDGATGEFFFLEMNARLQVEHPVTEAITGIDLVAEQIAIAEGKPLRLAQEDISFSGHAIECRINAEDSANDFRPSPGTIESAEFPAGEDIRIDTQVESGVVVPPWYDSLLAKLVVRGPDRAAAIRQLASALQRCSITGISTNIDMHGAVVSDPRFIEGGMDTAWFPEFIAGVTGS